MLAIAGFLFGNVTPVKAETCTWSASSSAVMSVGANWDNGAGGSCTITEDDALVFSGAKTSLGATWDAGVTTTASVTVNSDYSGTISIGVAAATTTGNYTQNGGTTTLAGGAGLFRIGGNLAVGAAGTFSGGTVGNLEFYGTTKTIGGAGVITLPTTTIAGTIQMVGNVTSTGVVTINASKSLDAAGYTLLLAKGTGAPLVITGTFTPSTSTVNYSGDVSATIAGTEYYNLIVNTVGTLGAAASTTNNLTVNPVKLLDLATYNLNFGGNIANSG
ncbi:MAG: hypothetical protein AAB678_01705, partial [Patescibacteria group bacterium]